MGAVRSGTGALREGVWGAHGTEWPPRGGEAKAEAGGVMNGPPGLQSRRGEGADSGRARSGEKKEVPGTARLRLAPGTGDGPAGKTPSRQGDRAGGG